ncbi:MAG: hypothetical protein HKN70_05320 [Gammaproteobacteria bacterium]|nr:hypothetical protein [Gammaproteobacteria bacterium]
MRKKFLVMLVMVSLLPGIAGCVGMVIGQTADAAIEVAKIPFKVGAAVIDVAAGDDENKKDEDTDKE